MNLVPSRQIGFIGMGNLAQAIVSAWIEAGTLAPTQIFASNRSEGKLKRAVEQFGIRAVATNEELIEACEIVILGVKPQDLVAAIEPIASSFGPHHIVLSLAAGVPLARLKRLIPNVRQWGRLMPNTPVKVRQGVTGYYLDKEAEHLKGLIEQILSPMGAVIAVEDEDQFSALAVACSSGVGFVFELMQYWQEWLEEHGFASQQAQQMTIKTFLGAAALATESGTTQLSDLQAKVVSKKGITAAGLQSMRELEVERLLRYSFEKAALRDQEIADEQNG